ncbi:MAG: isoprenyl transferase [Phycisphaeraceae bacterium]|nr:MAG: isoprenyl transferase [Phycisphaeraceae bacterium]
MSEAGASAERAAAAVGAFDDAAAVAALARMRRINPQADPATHLPDVHPAKIPRHIAIIMDGNGRWAEERGFPRIFGHRSGAAAVRSTIEECGRIGVECVTLYSFSSENWKRPSDEVNALMDLCVMYCDGQTEALVRENIRLRVIGRREGLPADVVAALDRVEGATAGCTGNTLCLALNYGSRAEIADAAKRIARDVAAGRLDPEAVDESAMDERLDTAGMPDPELLVRTAGEMRVSNFLLWQISYAELHVAQVCWPDFGPEQLKAAVRDFASRKRRFGGLDLEP